MNIFFWSSKNIIKNNHSTSSARVHISSGAIHELYNAKIQAMNLSKTQTIINTAPIQHIKHKGTSNPNKHPQYNTNKTRTRDGNTESSFSSTKHIFCLLEMPNILTEYEMKVQPLNALNLRISRPATRYISSTWKRNRFQPKIDEQRPYEMQPRATREYKREAQYISVLIRISPVVYTEQKVHHNYIDSRHSSGEFNHWAIG
jgi:hypothetical protein